MIHYGFALDRQQSETQAALLHHIYGNRAVTLQKSNTVGLSMAPAELVDEALNL